MEYSATFARLFSRLVSLLVYDAENVDEQKMALRAVVAVAKQGPMRLAVRDGMLYADDELMPGVLPGVREVADRMTTGGLREILFDNECAAGDVLGVARLLGGPPRDRVDLGPAFDALATKTIRALPAPPAPGAREALVAPVVAEAPRPVSEPEQKPPVVEVAPEEPPEVPGLVAQDSSAMFYQFSSIGTVKDSPEALLERLRAATNSAETVRLLDDVVTLAETAAREGKSEAVGELLYGVVTRESEAVEGEVKRAYVMALRRMSKPLLLRVVATLLPRVPDRAENYVAVLVRMGQDGAEALIDQLTQAQTADDRNVMFEVLQRLDAAVPVLVHMLGDARWFVARNAADLLAEMKAGGAESALVAQLHHADDRVRRSATNALMQLGTESARQAVRLAVRDAAPQVRMQAAFAIAAHRDPQTATTLITAIDAEQDSDVQLAMLLALGRVGTAEAVERLVRAAEPERGFFKKKSTAFRVAAVQALAEAKSAGAQAALRALASDKEKEVRDTVARLSQSGRRA
ncbi:MAG: HEAT repeat domain-containing protein [Gemmatimonadaceae bacterium]